MTASQYVTYDYPHAALGLAKSSCSANFCISRLKWQVNPKVAEAEISVRHRPSCYKTDGRNDRQL